MPSAKGLYPGGKYMKASDLTGAVTARILDITSKEIKEGEGLQLVVKLDGQEKG